VDEKGPPRVLGLSVRSCGVGFGATRKMSDVSIRTGAIARPRGAGGSVRARRFSAAYVWAVRS
jgi:hypothetical protein